MQTFQTLRFYCTSLFFPPSRPGGWWTRLVSFPTPRNNRDLGWFNICCTPEQNVQHFFEMKEFSFGLWSVSAHTCYFLMMWALVLFSWEQRGDPGVTRGGCVKTACWDSLQQLWMDKNKQNHWYRDVTTGSIYIYIDIFSFCRGSVTLDGAWWSDRWGKHPPMRVKWFPEPPETREALQTQIWSRWAKSRSFEPSVVSCR